MLLRPTPAALLMVNVDFHKILCHVEQHFLTPRCCRVWQTELKSQISCTVWGKDIVNDPFKSLHNTNKRQMEMVYPLLNARSQTLDRIDASLLVSDR